MSSRRRLADLVVFIAMVPTGAAVFLLIFA
jgi:hypothetical protein